VEENVAFGLRYKNLDRAARRRKVEECLALVRLEGFDRRYPEQLSGGQRQRVALARALAPEPAVLLLDEPLGALDQKLRKEVQVELKSLQRRLGITFLFVTHDQEEALAMSDRIAVMNRGRIEQLDASPKLFEYPRTEFVAEFMGASNFFTASVRGLAEGLLSLSLLPGVDFKMPAGGTRPHDEVRFVVRPEKLDLRAEDQTSRGLPSLPVTVQERLYQGVSTVWLVRDGRGESYVIYEQNERPFEERSQFEPGSRAFLCWDPRHAVLLPAAGS
jgi:spermidine/putrescine transport system ATP-binding protein